MWSQASTRRNSMRFPGNRSANMTYKLYRHTIDTTSIRRDFLKDDLDYHGYPMVALSRSIKVVVQPDDSDSLAAANEQMVEFMRPVGLVADAPAPNASGAVVTAVFSFPPERRRND